MPDFHGTKICQDASACAVYRDLCKVTVENPERDKLLVATPSLIGGGGNSGFQALNLAVQFGATRILLVGFDMHSANGLHWHGPHGGSLHNPDDLRFVKWRRALDATAPTLAALNIDVINASMQSTLMAFPQMTIEDALQRWGLYD